MAKETRLTAHLTYVHVIEKRTQWPTNAQRMMSPKRSSDLPQKVVHTWTTTRLYMLKATCCDSNFFCCLVFASGESSDFELEFLESLGSNVDPVSFFKALSFWDFLSIVMFCH